MQTEDADWPPPGVVPATMENAPFVPLSAREWGNAIQTLVMFDMFGAQIEGEEA